MAKIYKTTFYFTDANDEMGNKDFFKEELINILYDLFGTVEIKNIEESEKFEWNDELEINKVDAPIEEYDKFFKKKSNLD